MAGVQLKMAFPSWMPSSWALKSGSDNHVPQGLPWHYSFVKHVLANSMKSLWSSACHKQTTILIKSLILNTNILLGSYFMSPSSPLPSPARLDVLSSQHKTAPYSLPSRTECKWHCPTMSCKLNSQDSSHSCHRTWCWLMWLRKRCGRHLCY